MGSKLQKNAIISGYIHSYCLVCECYFDKDEDTIDHIEDKDHADKLLSCPYLEKYGNNHIRKVNKGYFCEFCSLLLTTAAKVSFHVQEKSHYERKGTFLLRRPSGTAAVIAFDDLLIDERAWHSLSEDTCAICNEEFSNENIHKTGSIHLLRLVQTRVEFGADNTIYRKTDDSFQCLTCNSVFALSTLSDHFADSEHKNLYAKCQEEYKKYTEQNKSNPSEKTGKELKDAKENGKTDDAKQKKDGANEKKNDVKENKSDVASQNANNNKTTVDKNHNNIKENSSSTNNAEKILRECGCTEIVRKTTTPIPEDEASVYANGNNLTYNPDNTNAFCRICETKLPSTLRSMKEHVNGKEHQSRLAKANSVSQTVPVKSRITKRSMEKFVQYSVHITNVFGEDVVVNETYCVSLASFVMMTKVGPRYRCQVCEVAVSEEDIREHSEQQRHQCAMKNTPVVTSLPDSEFVREVRTGIFHCAFCNLIVPQWDDVASHLLCREHRDNKDACAWRLKRHLPAVIEHRRRQDVEDFMAIHLRMLYMMQR